MMVETASGCENVDMTLDCMVDGRNAGISNIVDNYSFARVERWSEEGCRLVGE
jgi:hypothetical protein